MSNFCKCRKMQGKSLKLWHFVHVENFFKSNVSDNWIIGSGSFYWAVCYCTESYSCPPPHHQLLQQHHHHHHHLELLLLLSLLPPAARAVPSARPPLLVSPCHERCMRRSTCMLRSISTARWWGTSSEVVSTAAAGAVDPLYHPYPTRRSSSPMELMWDLWRMHPQWYLPAPPVVAPELSAATAAGSSSQTCSP